TRAAATTPRSVATARPPTKRAAGSPDVSTLATSVTELSATSSTVPPVTTAASGSAPSVQQTSAGRMSVATWPGGATAAATASAASWATADGSVLVRIQVETLRATLSMSDWSGASYWAW